MASTSHSLRALSRCWKRLSNSNLHPTVVPQNLSSSHALTPKSFPLHADVIVKDVFHGNTPQPFSLLPLMARQMDKIRVGRIRNSSQCSVGFPSLKNVEQCGFSVRGAEMSKTVRQFHSFESVGKVSESVSKHLLPELVEKHLAKRAGHTILRKSGKGYSTSSWTQRLQQQVADTFKKATAPKEISKPAEAAKSVVKSVVASGGATTERLGINTLLKNSKATAGRLATQYREAAALQVEAFWRRNYPIILGCVAILLVMLLWRIMYGVASTFISFSEGMAKYGFLALASSIVAFTGLYLRARYTINPDAVYRQTMRMLQINAKVLEVMGAPLSGSDVRAYVMSGGGLRLKNYKVGLSSRRCFLIFPIRGSEGRGLVSAEIKKKAGKYDFKLLAVDVASTGPETATPQRIYVLGNEKEYVESGGVIAELRDPVVKALAKQKDFDAEDDREAEEEARAEREERERRVVEKEQAAEREAAAERERKLEEARKKQSVS